MTTNHARTARLQKIVTVTGLLSLATWISSRPVETSQAGGMNRPTGMVGPILGGARTTGPVLADANFYIHDLGHRCLDFGAQTSWTIGGPVYIYSCNGSAAQEVRVRELDDSHDVHLGVASLFCIGVRGGHVLMNQPLELQVCDDASPAQRFALDGDAILIGAQQSGRVTRDFVIEPQSDYTVLRTPLVVSSRETFDGEYFRFDPVDHSTIKPTYGFVSVTNSAQLDWALSLGWGTVIEVSDRQSLELRPPFPKTIDAGVTLRGYRKYTYQGPEIYSCNESEDPAFLIIGGNVRVTGLRLRGPNGDPRCAEMTRAESQAIRINTAAATQPPTWIDHLDVSFWTGSAVDVRGLDDSQSQTCPVPPPAYPRPYQVRVVDNFIHHNGAYGAVTGQGAFVLDQANVFYGQWAHSLASDPWGTTGYAAYDNLVLSGVRDTHDFDAHGSLDPGHWEGGLSGDYYDMGWNTFLHTGHANIMQRGTPCRFTAIHDNVFLQSQSDAIVTHTQDLSKHVVYANQFNAPNPTADLGVGDFDGDGISDVFLGTGNAWYFSSGGQAEWRFLNQMPEHASALRFGDFDGDGRTDVIALHGADIDVSWGGVSPWQTINVVAWTLADIAVGDFDGDGRSDLFLSTGAQWFYAPGGKNWTPFADASQHASELLFGDFQLQGRTQVLRIQQGRWLLAALGQSWTNIGAAPASTIAGLIVGDFDGDGAADVAGTRVVTSPVSIGLWQYTSPGRNATWSTLRIDSTPMKGLPVGRFQGNPTTDILTWNGPDFFVAPAGRNPVHQISRQDMR